VLTKGFLLSVNGKKVRSISDG